MQPPRGRVRESVRGLTNQSVLALQGAHWLPKRIAASATLESLLCQPPAARATTREV